MFVFTLKSSKKKIILSVLTVFIATILIFVIFKSCNRQSYNNISNQSYDIYAKDNTQRINFIAHFGWSVDLEPIEIVKVTIPETFNAVYENYNNIQHEQGFVLENYKGKVCTRYTYLITNYPGTSAKVYLNLLTFDDQIIAGDICSRELNGFMHGLNKPNSVTT